MLFRRRTAAQRLRDKTDGQLRERSKRAPRSPGLRKYVCLILPVMCPAANGGERRTKDLAGSQQRWRGGERKRVIMGEGREPLLFDPSQQPE